MTTLDGRHVVLTRTPEDCAAWEAPLAAAGATVTRLPCIRIEVADDAVTRARLARALDGADWLILTSRRGVDALVTLAGRDAVPEAARIAVVGPATAAAAEAALGRVDRVGTGGTAADLAAEIVADRQFAPGQRCVAALAANAGTVIGRTLGAAGAELHRIDVYRTVPIPRQARRRSLAALAADAIVFSSPTTVAGFLNQVEIDADCPAYSIGPSTSAALVRAGLDVTGEAAEPDIDAIIAIIARHEARAQRAAGGREP